jgi:hypothetical protein
MDIMTRRRVLLIASLSLSIAVVLGVFATLAERSSVTKPNFDRIEKGMTKAEVENRFRGDFSLPWADPPLAALRGSEKCIIWVDRKTLRSARSAYVYFDKNDKVSHTTWVDETMLNKTRRWLNGELQFPDFLN